MVRSLLGDFDFNAMYRATPVGKLLFFHFYDFNDMAVQYDNIDYL